MKRLQVTILCLLLSSLCNSENKTEPPASSPSTNSTITSTVTSTPMPTSREGTLTSPAGKSTGGTTPKGTTTKGVMTTEANITSTTVRKCPLSTVVSTLQSSHPKTGTPSSITATETSVNISPPDASSPFQTSLLTSIPVIPENVSPSQSSENGKNASASSASPSYSSIILPVVIALIVITLSVFVLVGLYRMCWKTDPGTPENGNDQPQSDKESVKLLTVKTISHESGEHSAQGKTKN
ncbi:endomucin [Vicugna pacos]|uniref:Endomucin n=1 Tax=Vicugna pacos TaxID=30538 RepID=A0A6J0AS63_VICPA|nr:endomucin isoform X2 [Vicugna pacos]XP_015098774.1 endomucin isoform X2 [Vicugna pacos]XP_015098775.1 endomucin isoform X2 [Vicugna pacos]XP_031546143.1 endomucin isoform X2 [Vicugna pacos]XP_031546145.1 endomucin isoform X2 [Vicugna pacos]